MPIIPLLIGLGAGIYVAKGDTTTVNGVNMSDSSTLMLIAAAGAAYWLWRRS
jgi:hypothetical protein